MRRQTNRAAVLPVLLASLLAVSCGVSNPPKQSDSHLQRGDVAAPPASRSAAIPQVSQTTYLPQPQAVPQGAETYTVVVNQVPVRDLLFALARDSEINIDIASGIEGQVTLNAIDQTLLQILDRIMLQVPLRYQLKDDLLLIMADEPYLHSYKVDYLNMERSSTSRVALATRVGTVGSADVTDASGGASVNDNNSEASIENLSRNEFWDTLITNVAAIMGLEDLEEADESVHGNTQVIVNREAGYLSARASGRQHREIQHYIDQITASARRQVLIEATIVEVTLNDTFQAGIDWQILGADPTGFDITQSLLGANLAATPFFSFSYTDPSTDAGEVTATVKALEQFGDVQVLSSPKIIALNNQTAILKVVDNVVYFTSEVQTQTTDNTDRTIFQTTVHTVPVGFVMNVTPFISEVEEIILNVRPTISRVVGTVKDPNPALANSDPPVESEIPEIQVREMESMLRVGSGQIAVIGGLMQDKVDKKTSGVPFLSSLPLIGPAFTYRDDQVLKTELIVFLRPRVIHVADVGADLSDFRQYLPQARTPDELREAAGKHLQQ